VTPSRDPDPWPIYAEGRDRLIELVRTLDDADVARPVPLTPDWSIRDVLAHVCGLNADIAAGIRTGLGTPARTTHQVRSRAGRSLESICEEWLANADAMRAAMDDDPFLGHRLTADLTVHRHDVEHALGARSADIEPADPATRCGAHTYASVVTDLVLERSGIELRIELDDGSTFTSSATSSATANATPGVEDRAEITLQGITLRASPFDWLRTATGRRSRGEVLTLDWSGDPTPLLEHLCPYGPLREHDSGF
jgi:uncharacterized protein (TIGR03083 family)